MKKLAVLVPLLLGLVSAKAASFTAGNVVVLQCAGVSSSGNAGSLLEYTPSGTLAQTITLPSSGSPAIVFGNTVSLPHDISLSGDGALVVIPGYAQTATSIESTTAAADNRVIATVKWDGTVAFPIINSALVSGQSVRGATSDGFGNFWVTFTSGMRYVTPSAPTVSTTVNGTGSRACAIFNGQLYATVTAGVDSTSPNVPTGAATYVVYISGATSADGFAIPAGPTTGSTAYVANYNDTTGISAFTWNGASWNSPYLIKFTGISGNPEHLAVDYSGASPVLYFTTTSGANNGFFKYVDNAGAGTFTPTTLATASGGAIFRGVALAPTPPAAPTFTTQPQGQTNNYGATVTFGPVAATGANPNAWTWKFGSTVLTNGNNGRSSTVSGATSDTLTISGITSADRGNYFAVAANNGPTPTTSAAAYLELLGSCISPNLASATNCAGTTAHFTAGTSGCQPPLSFAWTYNDNPLSDGPGPSGLSTISGSTTASLQIANVQDGDAGVYALTVTDGNSAQSVSSATLTVADTPGFSQHPANQNKVAGQTATFSVVGTGNALSYQWKKDTSPISDGPSGSGSIRAGTHSATMWVTNAGSADMGSYTCTITNVCGTATSDPATLTVGFAPSFTTAPADTNVFVGSNAVFHGVVTGTATLTYTWKHNGTTLANDGVHIFGADTDTLTIVGVQVGDALNYNLTATNGYGSANRTAALGVETAVPKPNTVPGQIIYDPFDYPTGPYPAVGTYSWDHIISIYNQVTGQPVFWYNASGALNAAVQDNDLVNWNSAGRTGPGQYPWPGVDCNSVNLWYWSSAANNNHLRFGGVDQTNGAAYFSCIFDVDQGAALSQGTFDVVGGLTSGTDVDSWNYKLCTQVSSGGDSYILGVFKGNGTVINSGSVNGQWVSGKTLFRGQMHFLVGCYKFGSGTNLVGGSLTNDDIVSLWIDPDRSTFGRSEANVPAPDAGGMLTNWNANAPITEFGLRGSVPPASKRMTDLRIGKTWASVTKPYYPKVKIASSGTDATVSWPAKDTPYDSANNVYHGYQLQESSDLTTWTDIAPPYTLDGTGTNDTFTESLDTHQSYRLVEPPR
jgi:hypothetical protein